MTDSGGSQVAVIGVGNAFRGDDAAGLQVVRSVRESLQAGGIAVHELEGEPTRLLDAWEGCDAVVIVDATHSDAPAGTIRRLEGGPDALPGSLRGSASTHALSLREALELGRTLGRLPCRVVVYGIEGQSFETGGGLSAPVRARLPGLAWTVLAESLSLQRDAAERLSRRDGYAGTAPRRSALTSSSTSRSAATRSAP